MAFSSSNSGRRTLYLLPCSQLSQELLPRYAEVGCRQDGDPRFVDVGAVDNDFAHRDIGRNDFAVAVQNHSAMRRDGKADGMFLRGEVGDSSCLTTCSSMRRAENPVKMIPTTPLAIIARRHAFHLTDETSRWPLCASAALIGRDGLSNPSDVVVLNRLQGDQALVKLAWSLAREERAEILASSTSFCARTSRICVLLRAFVRQGSAAGF